MNHQQRIHCIHCQSDNLRKNGHSENGTQRWVCTDRKKSFQLTYSYKAHQPGIKEQIIELTLNSSGVRDIGRILGISTNTVISVLKKTPRTNPYLIDKIEDGKLAALDVIIEYRVEADEFWSFVGSKDNQRWTWYAMIVAWHNGKRTDADFLQLLDNMHDIPIGRYYTDDWSSYSRFLPKDKHVISKDNTWKIERKNLNFRTHIKRLIKE